MPVHPTLSAGLLILPVYFLLTLAIGWLARRHSGSANAYLNASRSLPLWIVTSAYLAANCGALEVVGLSAMAAQYGVQAFDFYWIGAIPAMIFLSLWMMPVYRRSGIRTIPEYLELRYGPGLRLLNAAVLAVVTLLLAGISLYAMAQVLQAGVGIGFGVGVLLCASVVLAYVLVGGLRATIYNEVFQLLIMLAGLVPLAIYCIHAGALGTHHPDAPRWHLWLNTPAFSRTAPLDLFGVIVGLGIVLSFGYWCTDFVLMQRAFTARTETAARQVPLWAGFGKLIFGFIVVTPGLAAFQILPRLGHEQRFDQALPAMMQVSYGPLMLGVGLTALLASLMSGLAANVSAFAAIWTEDIYRSQIVRCRPESHYLLVGRISACAAIAISLLTCYLDFFFKDLMEHVQLIFSVFGAPFWAIFLLGMTSRRATERGAIIGFVAGSSIALAHLLAVAAGWIQYGTIMSANFHAAIYAFGLAFALGFALRSPAEQPAHSQAAGLLLWQQRSREHTGLLLWVLSGLLLTLCVVLNWLWR